MWIRLAACSLMIVSMLGCATTTLIDFEDLSSVTAASPNPTPVSPGDTFHVGDFLIENKSGARIVVVPYAWDLTTWTSDGSVSIVTDNQAGGGGNEVHFNNACLGVIAPTPTTIKKLKLKYGEHGGSINLLENGKVNVAQDFFSIPSPTTSGVIITATNPTAGPLGTLILNGDLLPSTYPFPGPALPPLAAVVGGGQELWIDDLEFTQ